MERGPGDDAAVLHREGRRELLTVDTMVEGEHFTFEWFTPEQVGRKAIEANVSDIAAMGGEPRWALLALTLPGDRELALAERFFAGLYQACDKYGVALVGGDLTRGPVVVVTVTLAGEMEDRVPVCRSGARPGDAVMVTGSLGGAQAGLLLLRGGVEGFEEVKRRHLEPEARLALARAIAPGAHAMEDVSDGLARDLANLCEASGCGAEIQAEALPIEDAVRAAASRLGKPVLELALHGGEDYELLYTADPRIAATLPGSRIGRITAGRELRLVDSGGGSTALEPRGWDPFAG